MKLNLPSTLTAHRAAILFFLTLLHLKQTEAGNAFKNCLASEYGDTTSYDKLLGYPFPAGEFGTTPNYYLEICCDSNQCQSWSSICDNKFSCIRLGGKITCSRSSFVIIECQGIIGNEPITINAVDRQDDNYCAESTVSIVIPLTNCLKTIMPVGLDKAYAYYNITSCPASARGSLSGCNWDSQGMVCHGSTCWIQFPLAWPGTASNNPMLIQATVTSTTKSITQTSSLPSPTNLPTGDHLIEKIAIPLGSITGVSLTSFLTYYFCKRKKQRKAKLMLENNSLAETNDLETQEIELTKKELTTPELNSNFIQPEQNDLSFALSEQNDLSLVQSEQKIELAEAVPVEKLITFTPPTSPVPQTVERISAKQMLLNELKARLIGSEDLWNDYLDLKNLVTNNPTSQFALKQLDSLQNQLLQFFTISEIGFLIEDNHCYPNNLQTEYTEFIEQSPVQSFNVHSNSPQLISYRGPQWRG